MTKLNKLMMATAFIFSISSFHLVAEDTTTGTVEAEVLSQDGSTVSGASVTIKSTDKGITMSTTADENGNLRFVLLHTGSYEILVQAAGYNALSDVISVGVGDLSFDFVLFRFPIGSVSFRLTFASICLTSFHFFLVFFVWLCRSDSLKQLYQLVLHIHREFCMA